MLTKEKLRHYLAFECAIREIAAVSDRHCLATDNPRTSVATISLSHSLSLWARFTRAVRSLSRLPSLLSSFTTLACLVRGVYLHKPANCVLVSFVPYERPFQYPLPIPDAWKDPFTRENWPFARTSSSPFCLSSFHNYSDYSPLSRSSYLTFPWIRSFS